MKLPRIALFTDSLAFVELEQALLAAGRSDFEIRFVGHGSMTERLKAVMSATAKN